MRDLAEKLMNKKVSSGSRLESALFGSITDLANALDVGGPQWRIGLWPILSDRQPMVAMGLMTVLGFLLEDWSNDITVYRLFARLEGEPSDYAWSPDLSQFEVDDWGLDDLNENVAVWGGLKGVDGSWVLTLEVENDQVVEPDDLKTFTYKASQFSELVAGLPKAVEEIVEFLDIGEQDTARRAYQVAEWKESYLKQVLEQIATYEVRLLLGLWGQIWPVEKAKVDYKALFDACSAIGNEFGDWLAPRTLARGLSPVFSPLDEGIFSLVGDVVTDFGDSMFPYIFLCRAVSRIDSLKRGSELLENVAGKFETEELFWLNLGRLYRDNRYFSEAVDAYQRGIDSLDVSKSFYLEYAELLSLLDAAGVPLEIGFEQESVSGRVFVEDVILVDPDTIKPEEVLAREIVAAYREVLKDGDDLDVLRALIAQLIDLEDYEALWGDFERVVNADKDGSYVQQIIQSLSGLSDVAPAIQIMRKATSQLPDRFDVLRNLGALLLTDEQYDEARYVLGKARKLTDDEAHQADIDRLSLTADDPDFEVKLAELAALVNANASLKAEDVDFLEESLGKAPALAEGYVLLARAYIKWNETDDALEVLLDGQKRIPEHPGILELLAATLWRSDERALAMRYLNKGLTAHPTDVPLLALAGRCLFEDGQDEMAKEFLLRAEAIAPHDPALVDVRAYIAKSIG
ncbi:MAG: hypothetical protein H6672_10190 [Anaerolineaceae bacterium]|nr:hypothetical protein [Anaerolineaceae bacterium]